MIRVDQAMATTETRPARRAIPAWLLWGTAIGLVQIFAIATVQPLGVSTAYPQFVGFVVEKLVPGFGASQPYLQKIGTAIGWEVMLVMGIPIGALLSRLLAGRSNGNATACALPSFWSSSRSQAVAVFVGGFLIIFGARLANGCTSGHMLSGMAQLALSGFLFGAAAFTTGTLTALLLMKRSNRAQGGER
jgi:uncharacterized membrane protein YedE/YeeE